MPRILRKDAEIMISEDNLESKKAWNTILYKLENKSLETSDLLGIICCTIYSRDIFCHNRDIVPFLFRVFNKTYLKYVIDTRTLIVARITKYVYSMDEKDKFNVQLEMAKYIKNKIDERKSKTEPLKQNKKKNENNKLETWLKGL